MSETAKSLEIYIHIPFCIRKCAYCDFLSAPMAKEKREAYHKALLKEIQCLPENKEKRPVSTIFIGGGTPSILKEEIGQILAALREHFIIEPDAEISMEANPGTLTGEKLSVYRRAGVNRLSLGLQSINEEELKKLGRIHTYEDFLASYRLARELGFDNINIDLMFALPDQRLESWTRTLHTVGALSPEHISAYSLIIEEGTPFASADLHLPEEETEYEMYESAARILKEYGFRQYEISNYAKAGFECRHNTGYWNRTDYLGLGLGASSLYLNTRWKNTDDFDEYIHFSSQPRRLRKEIQNLDFREQMEEFVILGLRMTEGIDERDFAQCFAHTLKEFWGRQLQRYTEEGFMEYKDHRYRFTRKGIHVSNTILADFLF